MINKAKQKLLGTLVSLFQSISYATPPEDYPLIGYRDHKYTGIHCIPVDSSTTTPELFILKTNIAKIATIKQLHVDVAEFFSGRQYQAELTKKDNYYAIAERNGNKKTIDCIPKWRFDNLDKKNLIDETGDYLTVEHVGSTGEYGDIYLNNKCDAGKLGWVDCDVGTIGFSRRSKNGIAKWARLIAIGIPFKNGHPLYELPRALNIIDNFNYGTPLNDGTAILTYLNHMSIRIDLRTGLPVEPRSNIASVPLNDWAQLKHVLYERWNGSTRLPCEQKNKKCWQDLTEMYFYGLQNYLFPSH